MNLAIDIIVVATSGLLLLGALARAAGSYLTAATRTFDATLLAEQVRKLLFGNNLDRAIKLCNEAAMDGVLPPAAQALKMLLVAANHTTELRADAREEARLVLRAASDAASLEKARHGVIGIVGFILYWTALGAAVWGSGDTWAVVVCLSCLAPAFTLDRFVWWNEVRTIRHYGLAELELLKVAKLIENRAAVRDRGSNIPGMED